MNQIVGNYLASFKTTLDKFEVMGMDEVMNYADNIHMNSQRLRNRKTPA